MKWIKSQTGASAMKMTALMIAILLGPLGAGMALADDDDCNVPVTNWQPRDAVQKMAEAQGWKVRRIKTDDGCYKIKGWDGSGRAIEVKVDPGSLSIVDMEYEDDDEADDATTQKAVPSHTTTPPDNDLFNSGPVPKVEVN